MPAFWVTGALNEARALLQKLLSVNYSNLVTAAFNYNPEAGNGEKQKETDKEGMIVWEFEGKKYKFRDLGGRGVKVPNHNNLDIGD